MDSRYVPWLFIMGVSPFGNLRVVAYLQLTAAYRSLSRPSSAPDAKAFTLCSCSLELSASVIWPLLFVSLNCLSFFVHIFRFAVKKLSLSHRSIFFLRFHARRNCFYPTFLERPIFLNIMSSISVRFYSFTFIRFSMNMVLTGISGLVEMMGIEPMTPCLQGRCSPSWATPRYYLWGLLSFLFGHSKSNNKWKYSA